VPFELQIVVRRRAGPNEISEACLAHDPADGAYSRALITELRGPVMQA
jgi:hypothetical protein